MRRFESVRSYSSHLTFLKELWFDYEVPDENVLKKGVKEMRNYIEIPIEDEDALQEYLDKYYN